MCRCRLAPPVLATLPSFACGCLPSCVTVHATQHTAVAPPCISAKALALAPPHSAATPPSHFQWLIGFSCNTMSASHPPPEHWRLPLPHPVHTARRGAGAQWRPPGSDGWPPRERPGVERRPRHRAGWVVGCVWAARLLLSSETPARQAGGAAVGCPRTVLRPCPLSWRSHRLPATCVSCLATFQAWSWRMASAWRRIWSLWPSGATAACRRRAMAAVVLQCCWVMSVHAATHGARDAA